LEYKRNCPKCGDEIIHINPRSFKWAKRDGKPCRNCYSKEISKTLKGRDVRNGNYRSAESERVRERNFHRNCPDCGEQMSYMTEKLLLAGERKNTICNRCSAYKYKKTFNDVITEDHRKQMRATKAGYDDWDEYLEKYPEKEMYKREVWRLTYQNPLKTLEHWNKRGRCGVDGAYQLDHINGISEGYHNGTPPEEIAQWSNLRMIPWADNREKW
jgi:endogenous inhibitor of DNA gyrase (YacG/DUF329 family)